MAEVIEKFVMMVENQFSMHVQVFRSANAKEYMSQSIDGYFTKWGIIHETSCSYTPQNGVAERKNRHLLEVTWTIMFQRNVPKHFWRKTILTSAYLINRMLFPCSPRQDTYVHVVAY